MIYKWRVPSRQGRDWSEEDSLFGQTAEASAETVEKVGQSVLEEEAICGF